MPRKKLNIWIAYSDLFSNLTVFFFVVTISSFAAIGSAAMMKGMGQQGMCETLEKSFLDENNRGLLRPLDKPKGENRNCVFYYAIPYRDVASPPADAALISKLLFVEEPKKKDSYGQTAEQIKEREDVLKTTLQSKLCEPIWVLATAAKGKQGSALIVLPPTANDTCDPRAATYASLITTAVVKWEIRNSRGEPTNNATIKQIQTCDKSKSTLEKRPHFCAIVRDCQSNRNDNRSIHNCSEIFKVEDFYKAEGTSCLAGLASRRAWRLYSFCEMAVYGGQFDKSKAGQGRPSVEKWTETQAISDTWRTTADVRAFKRGKLPSVSDGTLVVKVEIPQK